MSANNPCPRSVRANRHVREQTAFSATQRLQQSVNWQWLRIQIGRKQSITANCQRLRTRKVRRLSANMNWPRIVRAVASLWPSCHRFISRFASTSLPPMTAFDPATVRQAVAEFTPLRPQKFQDLLPAKDVIAELRQRRASYRAIAELLTQHCLPTSKTAIAAFCHQVLAEIVRPRRRPPRRRPASPAEPNGHGASPAQSGPTDERPPHESPDASNGGETPLTRSRGPRIAQVRMLKPESK